MVSTALFVLVDVKGLLKLKFLVDVDREGVPFDLLFDELPPENKFLTLKLLRLSDILLF